MRIILAICLLIFATPPLLAEPRKLADLAYGAAPLQKLDVYTESTHEDAPIIVMLHGGAWEFGDKSQKAVWQPKVARWVPEGYVFVSVNTRLLPDPPEKQAEDFARAVGFVQDNAEKWGGDPERLVLMGHSAGAHIAALVAGDSNLRRRNAMRPVRGTVLLDTAAIDLEALMKDNPHRIYRRAFGTDPAYWASVSPLSKLDSGASPFLVVCSTKRLRVCDYSERFAETATEMGVTVTILPVPMRHGPINRKLGEPSPYTRAVDQWLAKHLR